MLLDRDVAAEEPRRLAARVEPEREGWWFRLWRRGVLGVEGKSEGEGLVGVRALFSSFSGQACEY
jgi:hypothetical protein